MRIIHTADWHLGQRLCNLDRHIEHDCFLQWLLEVLDTYQPDALIVAGDVFDMGNPPNYALKQYYDFLQNATTRCRNIIITGGNHDSVATLNAPKELLQRFNVQVVGGACHNIEDEVIPVKNEAGEVIGIVGAVPFLRDRDLRAAVAGEEYSERVQRVKEGIRRHYEAIRDCILPYKEQQLPIVVTGHLFAAGSTTSDSEKDIHIGNQGKVTAEVFPPEFTYVALGHIHKPQVVNNLAHIRYSGSPIPLSFTERKDQKQLLCIDFEKDAIKNIESIKVPVYRQLLRIKGSLQKVKEALLTFDLPMTEAAVWAEVIVELDNYEPRLAEQVKEWAKDKNVDILKTRVQYSKAAATLDEQLNSPINLDELEPVEVFIKKCESKSVPPKQQKELVNTFNELVDWMGEG